MLALGCWARAPCLAPLFGDVEGWPLRLVSAASPTVLSGWAWHKGNRRALSSQTYKRPKDSTFAFSKEWATLQDVKMSVASMI